jgi:hypothetical protein
MKTPLLIFAAAALLGLTPSVSAQVRLTLDVNDIVKSTFFTEANSDAFIDGINGNATQGKQFAMRLIPSTGGGWTGAQATGVYLTGGAQESFNGVEATVTIEGYGTMHGLIVHTTGNEGMALICISDTGGPAVKCLQNNLFDYPANLTWRAGTTVSTDSAAREVHAPSGLADLDRWFGDGAGQTPSSSVDHFGAMHPPHVADTMALADSTYFSTTQSKLCYKDSSGAVHPLY